MYCQVIIFQASSIVHYIYSCHMIPFTGLIIKPLWFYIFMYFQWSTINLLVCPDTNHLCINYFFILNTETKIFTLETILIKNPTRTLALLITILYFIQNIFIEKHTTLQSLPYLVVMVRYTIHQVIYKIQFLSLLQLSTYWTNLQLITL